METNYQKNSEKKLTRKEILEILNDAGINLENNNDLSKPYSGSYASPEDFESINDYYDCQSFKR